MDPVEKQYRAERYRIEMYDYYPSAYPEYQWVKFKVYLPRKWWGQGWVSAFGSHVCENSRAGAYRKAEEQARELINKDIERRYKKKKEPRSFKTVYVEIN